MSRQEIVNEIETLRHLVIDATKNAEVEQPAENSLERLRKLYIQRKSDFTSEDIRWINVLVRFLRERLESHDESRRDSKKPAKETQPVRRRSGGQSYWSRIQSTLRDFCRPDDQLSCRRVFKSPGNQCQMCGHWPITWNHILKNERTSAELVVGSECIVNYKKEMEKMGHGVPPVIFQSAGAAEYLNRKCPGIAVFAPAPSTSVEEFDVDEFYEDREAEEEREWLIELGLDPNEPDFTELSPHGMSGDEDEDYD